jgi:mono/diheme cytochrome c family protein
MKTYKFLGDLVARFVAQTRRAGLRNPLRVIGFAAFIAAAIVGIVLLAVLPGAAQTATGGQQANRGALGNAENGRLVFEKQGCNKCHGAQGEGVGAPGSTGGVPRIASTALALPAFVQLVRSPKGQMPSFGSQKISDAELADVYAFLRALRPPAKPEAAAPESAKKGERLFNAYGCYECHGYQGQGSTQTGGSRLGPPRIPLSAFVSYVRAPSGQMPPYTAKAVSSEDLAEMYAFLQSIPQPAPAKSILLLNQ